MNKCGIRETVIAVIDRNDDGRLQASEYVDGLKQNLNNRALRMLVDKHHVILPNDILELNSSKGGARSVFKDFALTNRTLFNHGIDRVPDAMLQELAYLAERLKTEVRTSSDTALSPTINGWHLLQNNIAVLFSAAHGQARCLMR